MKRKILTALLITALAAGALAGCGNRAEGDGKVPAAVADAGNTGSLGGETPAPAETAAPTVEPGAAETAAPAAAATPVLAETAAPTVEPAATATPAPAVTVAPTAEPTPASTVTAAPTAKPVSAETAAPTAKPTPAIAPAPTAAPAPAETAAPTAAPAPAMTGQQAGNTGNQSDAGTGPETGSTSQGGEQTANQNNGDGGAVSSLQASASAELYNSEFITLLNADRAALGLNPVSDNGVLNSDALASAEALSVNYSHDSLVRISEVTNENIGRIQGFDSSASDIYLDWKNSAGHWAAMIDPDLQYCSVAKYGEYWVFLGYASNPIVNMSTEEAVAQGLLTQIGTNEDGNEIYASADGVEVEEDEDIIDELESLRDL